MIRKAIFLVGALLCATQVQAIEKNTINLDKNFWGKWSIFNPKTSCTESYEFKKPGAFTYGVNQKKLSGDFAVMRSKENSKLDVLVLAIKNDNGALGCSDDKTNYTNQQSTLALKWVTQNSAEICLDQEAKKCTGLYLNKK